MDPGPAPNSDLLMAFTMKIKPILGVLPVVVLLAGCSSVTKLFHKTDRSNYTAKQYYQEAKSDLDRKKYGSAIDLYQQLESTYPYGRYTEQAELDIAYAYYKNDNAEQALASADRFIRLHPTTAGVDYAYYIKGLVNFSESDSFLERVTKGQSSADRDPHSAQQSYDAFKELVDRFPNSRYAPDARQRMAFLHNSLAMHEIHVADYYMRREAYVAVVNRCKYVLDKYPRTAAVEHALGLMMLAYEKIGLKDLAADSRRVLALNFPHSQYLTGKRPKIKKDFSLIPASLNPFD